MPSRMWFLLEINWFKRWKEYVGYDAWDTVNTGNVSSHPGPIDNSVLFKDRTEEDVNDTGSSQLKELLVDELDYVLVPEQAWIMLVNMYGLVPNQKPIKRYVIERGMIAKHCRVEVDLMELKLYLHLDLHTFITKQFSQVATVEQLEGEMRRLFHVPESTEVQVWARYMSDSYECLSDKTKTLQDEGVYHGQVIVLEQRNSDGTWPMIERMPQASGQSLPQASSQGLFARLFLVQTKQKSNQSPEKKTGQQAPVKENTTKQKSNQSPEKKTAQQAPVKENTETPGEDPDLECAMCHEHYSQPKRLPCGHLSCAKCVLAWLQKGGMNSGCPLCRSPILTPTAHTPRDLAASVDALPTDLDMTVHVESHQVLQGPHVCGMCPKVKALSYCLQCCLKLCDDCTEYHQRLPITRDHPLEDLNRLTGKPVSPTGPLPMCASHQDCSVESFCTSHQALICKTCSSSEHATCQEVMTISEAAQKMREELRQQTRTLREKALEAPKQMPTEMQDKAKEVFDSLQDCVRKRRQEVLAQIQALEQMMRTRVDEDSAAVRFHTAVLTRLLLSTPDHALLTTSTKLSAAVSAMQQHVERTRGEVDQPDIVFDSQALDQLKAAIASLGK
ncbi:uncharacterized protein LOC143279875 isoform X2 [Babylonia areolata]|uniref:uncharacterized protein LOC143279875 isoform X2 n=1 Tax=Babylonia areolata TaxID=304850 RepID=UPI003FD281FC